MTETAEKHEQLAEGQQLHNGATVEDATVVEFFPDGRGPRLSVILCSFRAGYVVWTFNHETRGCSHGSYGHKLYADALRDYAKRIEFHQ